LSAILDHDDVRSVVVDVAGSNPIPTRAATWARVVLGRAGIEEVREGDLALADLGALESAPGGAEAAVTLLRARGVAAVMLRLRDEDPRLPGAIAAAAARHEVPVVALHVGIRLGALAETINRAIIEAGLARLEATDRVDRELNATLADGAGLSGLIDAAAELTGAPVALLTPLRRVVAASGLAANEDARRLLNAPGVGQATVDLQGRVWGVVCTARVEPQRRAVRDAVLEMLPRIVAIELMRFSEALPAEERVRREFIIDLLAGTIRTSGEFLLRSAFTSFNPCADALVVGIAMPLARGLPEAVAAALDREDIATFCAPLNNELMLLAETSDAAATHDLAHRLLRALPAELTAARGPLIALGPPTDELADAGRSLYEARDTLAIARYLELPSRVVTAEAVAIERLLSRLISDPELGRFVEGTLQPLLEYDHEHGSQLVATLEAYLRHGLSKARTARDIGVRRQSLYSRLERVEALVGGLDDPEHRIALELALRARRLIREPSLGGPD
jgi:purine catabolism regulator